MNLAGSKFNGSNAEYFGTLAVFGAIVLTAVGVYLFVKSRQKKARIQHLAQRLDGRPLVYVSYAECGLPAPDVRSTAQARGYAMAPNGAALRYEFMRYQGRP